MRPYPTPDERHRGTKSFMWHQDLVRQCKPYRPHPALRAVAAWMRGRYGVRWYTDAYARSLVVHTLRRFGVAIKDHPWHKTPKSFSIKAAALPLPALTPSDSTPPSRCDKP